MLYIMSWAKGIMTLSHLMYSKYNMLKYISNTKRKHKSKNTWIRQQEKKTRPWLWLAFPVQELWFAATAALGSELWSHCTPSLVPQKPASRRGVGVV